MVHIYLDAAANTPIDPTVSKSMEPYCSTLFVGNSFAAHQHGREANIAIEESRECIAKALNCQADEVFFTSGATESNNWVIKSLAMHELSLPPEQRKMHIICSATEHSSVLNACRSLSELGFDISYVNPDNLGRITFDSIFKAVQKNTLLVCVLGVNNETGVQNDIIEIGQYLRARNILFLSDFTQALSYGKSSLIFQQHLLDVVDYISFSGHKIYAPTGIGCLLKRKDAPVYPLLSGGGQEQGLRGGTSNTAAIVGLGKAVELLSHEDYSEHYEMLYFHLIKRLNEYKGTLDKISLNLIPDCKNIVNLNCSDCFKDIQLSQLLAMRGVSVSSGSACDSTGEEQTSSHVLVAQGFSADRIYNSIRLSFMKHTTTQDIDTLIDTLYTIYTECGKEPYEN